MENNSSNEMSSHNNYEMDDMITDRSSAAIIPLEELIARYSEDDYLFHNRSIPILRSSIGIISVLCSMTVICLICRSSQGLTKSTQNRLIFGLCVSDILYSITTSLFNVMAPNENYYYQYTWNAHGDALSCDIQGFLITVGFSTGALYTCSLNLYYLAIVKYEKSDEYIRKKLEVYFHAIPIGISILGSIVVLVSHNLNVDPTGLCWLPVHDPPHCIGFEDGTIRDGFTIPCGRGRDTKLIYILLFALVAVSPPIIITISLMLIYKAVVEIEARLSKYGAASLRIPGVSVVRATITAVTAKEGSTERSAVATTNNNIGGNSGFCPRTFLCNNCSTFLRCKNNSGSRTSTSTPKKSSSSSKSRTVMHKAISYSISYVLTWVFATIVFFLNVSEKNVPLTITYLLAIFSCLQGFYTLIIYIYPKVILIHKKEKVSWMQAIIVAFQSRRRQKRTSSCNGISSINTSYYINNTTTSISNIINNNSRHDPTQPSKIELQEKMLSSHCEIDEEDEDVDILQLMEEELSPDFETNEGRTRGKKRFEVDKNKKDPLHLIEEQSPISSDIDSTENKITEEFKVLEEKEEDDISLDISL